MLLPRRTLLAGAAALSAAPPIRARAQNKPKIKLGVLTDLSGPYRDDTGRNSIACTQQAVAEFNPSSHGFDVEVIHADHKNDAQQAASIARAWCDQGVDALIDVATSSVALAVAQVVRQRDRVMLNSAAATTELTVGQCSPNTIAWSADTYMLARSQGGAMLKSGGTSWFFVTADDAFGHVLEEQTGQVVTKGGGSVKGSVRYPFPHTTDFSTYLRQAQASGAQVIGLAGGGLDAITSIRQAGELGLNTRARIAPLLMFVTDVHALGLALTGGLDCTTSFYWDRNDRSRAFTRRMLPNLVDGTYPNMAHASCYAATLHYLKVVAAMGAAAAKQSGHVAVARMKALPTDDDAFGKGHIRADGRGEFSSFLWKVKQPDDSKGEWDLLELVLESPAADVLHPISQKCRFPSGA